MSSLKSGMQKRKQNQSSMIIKLTKQKLTIWTSAADDEGKSSGKPREKWILCSSIRKKLLVISIRLQIAKGQAFACPRLMGDRCFEDVPLCFFKKNDDFILVNDVCPNQSCRN